MARSQAARYQAATINAVTHRAPGPPVGSSGTCGESVKTYESLRKQFAYVSHIMGTRANDRQFGRTDEDSSRDDARD